MADIGLRLRLAGYQAEDEPRLVLFGPLDADFRPLQQLFRWLAEAPGRRLRLDQESFVAPFGGVEISLGSLEEPPAGDAAAGQIRRRVHGAAPVFDWRETTDGWELLAELIEPIVAEIAPAHQYLTTYPRDDATFEISRGEYCDDVLATG